jgi:flagellar motor switch protein FliN/FliY
MDKAKSKLADDLTGAFQAVTEAGAKPMHFEPLTSSGTTGLPHDLDMVLDLPLTLTVELGRAKLPIGELLSMHPGAVLPLDVKAGDPLNVLVNGCLVARAEIVVTDGSYGIRLTQIVTPSERLRNLHS